MRFIEVQGSARLGRATRERGIHGAPGIPTSPASPASPSPGWPTATATPSTGRCAGGPSGSGGRSGRGATRCTTSRPTLDPDTYFALARATYREMAAAGITASASSTTCTTSPTGRRTTTRTRWGSPWSRPPARRASGSRCSTPATSRSGFGEAEPQGAQLRYSDGSAGRLGRQVGAVAPGMTGRAWSSAPPSTPSAPCRPTRCPSSAPGRASTTRPLHVHLSEQVAENDACLAAYAGTPTEAARRPRASSGRAPPSCTPPTSPTTTSRLLGERTHVRLLLPDHRARPRRRHRPVPRGCTTPAAGSRSAATATR